MATPTSKTELLKTHEAELVKQYIAYDTADRVSKVYTASLNAIHGGPCTITEYEYVDLSTSRVKKRKEYYGTWDSSYDI